MRGLKNGDQASARTLSDTNTREVTGTLEIIKVEGDDMYPPFTLYFVDGKEVDITTIKSLSDSVRASSTIIYDLFEYSNDCHSPEDGRFCSDPSHNHEEKFDVTHGGLEGFPPKRKRSILIRVENLQKEWGVRVNVDARPSEKGTHQNFAEETGALAAVAPWEPNIIHVNPKMADDKWLVKQMTNAKGKYIATNVPEIITHEYGHILEGELEQRGDFKTIAELHSLFTVIGEAELGDKFGKADRNRLRMEVSYYAGKDTHEGIAESFLAYTKGQRGSTWIDSTGEILTRTFKKGGKK